MFYQRVVDVPGGFFAVAGIVVEEDGVCFFEDSEGFSGVCPSGVCPDYSGVTPEGCDDNKGVPVSKGEIFGLFSGFVIICRSMCPKKVPSKAGIDEASGSPVVVVFDSDDVAKSEDSPVNEALGVWRCYLVVIPGVSSASCFVLVVADVVDVSGSFRTSLPVLGFCS